MDQSIENMQNVKVALVSCAAAGDCSAEAAAMPTLAMATADAATPATPATPAAPTAHETAVTAWKTCYKNNGSDKAADKLCAKE